MLHPPHFLTWDDKLNLVILACALVINAFNQLKVISNCKDNSTLKNYFYSINNLTIYLEGIQFDVI